MKSKNNFKYRSLGMLVSLLLLSACVSTEPKVSDIEERVTAYWDTLLSGDLAGAYEFLSPGYRSSVSSMDYQRSILMKQVQWTSAKYVKSDCTETTCTVEISLGYRVAGAVPGVKSFTGSQNVDESWINIDGMWYLVP
ncbi:MAG: hypothetical protein OEU84_05900 [Xanthomonadales bacterium]|nr:hypothetical protein [Xanthomonadales bacterium]MDH4019116.1 hypothetical protein [Xanthomonadales bacterium]